MSALSTPSGDPWLVQPRERMHYEEQFKTLMPKNGIVTGDQLKGFFLKSQLPPAVLGEIWGLADTDSDGNMDINEFSIACKLIRLKLHGYEVPKVVPPTLLASLAAFSAQQAPPAIPPLPTMPAAVPPAAAVVMPPMAPMPQVPPMIPVAPISPQQPLIPMKTSPPMVPPLPQVAPYAAMPQVVPMYGAPAVAPMVPNAAVPLVGLVSPPGVGMPPGVVGIVSPPGTQPAVATVVSPVASSTPTKPLDRKVSLESPLVEWAVPHQTKLKYTQLFNTSDRTRTGYLSGPQARNIMVQSKLPQKTLASIWSLSDTDADGRLSCEEFVLAMHLCEQAAAGIMPPASLPLDLIPPSFKRTPRHGSVSSQGSSQPEQDPASTLPQTSFEDKRKENFEKGQAELERRRKTLLETQRKEAEERERKEREENEKKEKARLEAERRRMKELEERMREQQEQERLKEEERKRQAEQREAARKEMERQRQLEWEKQRSQELQQQRQREQEMVLKLKAKNQSLSIELTSLNDQVKDLSQKICDTRVGVSGIKTTIDGMRSTRDSQMQEMSQLKAKLKEQNARLLALSQEKARTEARNRANVNDPDSRAALENRDIIIKQLQDKLEDMQVQIDAKMGDIENNNSQLEELKSQLTGLVGECETLYSDYEAKREHVLEMKSASRMADATAAWNDAPGADEWPVDSWSAGSEPAPSGTVRYRAIYEFVARNNDEISFQPGDIVLVPLEQKGEPGWLAGEIRGHTGWFPQSYVEPIESDPNAGVAAPVQPEEIETKRLEGIAEVPESSSDVSGEASLTQPQAVESTPPYDVNSNKEEDVPELYVATYPYQSVEQGDLSFGAGEVISVVKKDGNWWTGKVGDVVGIFPSNYVQKIDSVQAQDANSTAMMDNEVSQINEVKTQLEKSPDFAAMSANAQASKSGKKPEIASVIAPYQATSAEQLSLSRGQLIMIRKKSDTGWWEGELQAKGQKRQIGWFPASYVKVLSSGKISGRTTPVSTTRMQQEAVLDKVIALYPYTANNPDELSFLKDDIISVTAKDEEAWWRGELNGVSGVFPSNYVGPLQSKIIDDGMRRECINELISTERSYIEDMRTVYEVFEKPLRESKIISRENITAIFINWQEILVCNRNFLTDLLNRQNDGVDAVGDIICTHLPRMTPYIAFCGSQLDSASLLQKLTETSPGFKEFVKTCQMHPSTKGMPLSSFLIKPMQRITKYPLLIGKILENTPKNHEDYTCLVEAFSIADWFCKHINEGVRLKENNERLEWIQHHVLCDDFKIKFNSETNCMGPRKLLHFGQMQKAKSKKDLMGFLFNDFLMLVLTNKLMGTSQFSFIKNQNTIFKIYREPLFISDISVSVCSADNVENGTDANRVLKVSNKKYTMYLLVPSVNDCSLWLKKITDAKVANSKVKSLTNRKAKSSKVQRTDVYCKGRMGNQELVSEVAKESVSNSNSSAPGHPPPTPTLVWNSSMQFLVKNVNEDTLTISVYQKNLFEPDEFLGIGSIRVKDVFRDTRHSPGPILRTVMLNQVESGELTVKMDLRMFDTNY